MIEKKVVSQLVEEKLASSSNYLVDVVIKPGNLIVVETVSYTHLTLPTIA